MNEPHNLLIVLHGHGSEFWQYSNGNRGEARSAREMAAQNNMILVSPDYRVKTSWMGPAAEADLLQIIADLKKKLILPSTESAAQSFFPRSLPCR